MTIHLYPFNFMLHATNHLCRLYCVWVAALSHNTQQKDTLQSSPKWIYHFDDGQWFYICYALSFRPHCMQEHTHTGQGNSFIGGNARFPLCGTVERTMTEKRERRHKLLEKEMGPIARALWFRQCVHKYVCTRLREVITGKGQPYFCTCQSV